MKRFFRNPMRILRDGSLQTLFQFHVSLEGCLERILCRDDSDYDCFVKIICVCAYEAGVDLVIYSVVSNHAHFIVLSPSQTITDRVADEVKRRYSMHFCRKYHDKGAMKGISAKGILIDSDWYLRNAIAYDIRNAIDNGATNLEEYRWTGYSCAFRKQDSSEALKAVRNLTRREKERIMHTNSDLSGVRWMLNAHDEIEPSSVCNGAYIEEAFEMNQANYLRCIGVVNTAEMRYKLQSGPKTMMKDEDFLIFANEISNRWFKSHIHNLPFDKKARLIAYIKRIQKTSEKQLARAFELQSEMIATIQ